ncbi:hypothetical protein LIER_03372 [Lithospermum erythrorhizon]|uniref:Uncharacterized protein n=1 Tax=Lithospermum erythrorhizon TaxID=34254 RepID=A0AAV3NSV9_LITER
MGNCLFGGLGEENKEVVKVVTSNGAIMELKAPIIVESITDEFPGHGIFRNHDLFWKPLPHLEVLLAGQSYYLLPLNTSKRKHGHVAQVGHVRSNSVPVFPQVDSSSSSSSSLSVAPYRMSVDCQGLIKRKPYMEPFSRQLNNKNCGNGMWKVKLVICPEQLLGILSDEVKTEELIENVRTVAKCGNGKVGVSSSSSSVEFSDEWSLSSSSRNAASSKKHGFFEL